ncbi:MAG: hypothetical protein Q7L19_03215 [Pseudohongiella sp.]|nr:hypothetical protein [Pseudohongiella sp.]
MTTEPEKIPRQMPKGGRKGGSVFPRIPLKDAVGYARKLVSKTHTNPQPMDVIHSGVVGAKGGKGNVRMSALKQYGFLIGDAKSNFSAGDLAKKIVASPSEELVPLYQKAMLKPTVFKKLYDTYHGDTVSKAKLKQRAADLKVHPDETTTCIDVYVAGMAIAGLVSVDGDQVSHQASSIVGELVTSNTSDEVGERDERSDEELEPKQSNDLKNNDHNGAETLSDRNTNSDSTKNTHGENDAIPNGPRAVFNVNVTLDSSLDIEKLQRQLELLKRFGAI